MRSDMPWTSFRGRDPLTAWMWGQGKGAEGRERRIQDDFLASEWMGTMEEGENRKESESSSMVKSRSP